VLKMTVMAAQAVEIEKLEIDITSIEEPRTATIERVWIDDVRPRPGRTVNLKALVRSYRGEAQLREGFPLADR